MKALLLVIASSCNPSYDAMKRALYKHHTTVRPDWLDLRFVYGSQRPTEPCELDLCFPDVEETLIPGVFDKTVLALRQLVPSYDFVVRSNLSTWFHYEVLQQYLSNCPRTGLLAGCAPAGLSHVSGMCLIMSQDVVGTLLHRAPSAPREGFDDVEISELLMPDHRPFWVPKIDVHPWLKPDNLHPGTFVVRHKTWDRVWDAKFMEALVDSYETGIRSLNELLKRALVALSGEA
jgi:hypothetical protein